MKRVSAPVIALLVIVLSTSLFALEKDAAGCKDHPLIPRMSDYYIAGCGKNPSNFDFDMANGDSTHVEGPSVAVMLSPQPELKSKPSEAQVRSHVESAVTKQGGALVGTTPGQKWPVYKLSKDGKEFWIVLLINPGKYFTGSYTYRIIEK